MRPIICLLALCLTAPAAELLTIGKSTFTRQTSTVYSLPNPSLYLQAIDANATTVKYTVRWIADNASWQAHGYTDSLENTSNCTGTSCGSGNHAYLDLSVATGISTIGTVNLRDGNVHLIYPWAISKVADDAAHDVLMQFAPFRVKWDATNSNVFPEWQTTTTSGTIPYNKHLILINSSDPCSTGSAAANPCGTAPAGNKLCTVSGTDIYDNAPPGYLMKIEGASDCTNVQVITLTHAESITGTDLGTAISSAMSFAATNHLEAIIRGWGIPDVVVYDSTANWNNCAPSGTKVVCAGIDGALSVYAILGGTTQPGGATFVGNTFGLGKWDHDNPWLGQYGNFTPFTTFNFRPSTSPVLFNCPACTTGANTGTGHVWVENFAASKQVIDDAHAAIGSNPTGVAQWSITNVAGGTAHFQPEIAPSSLVSGALNPKVTPSICGTFASQTSAAETSCTQTNNILYQNDAAQYNLPTISFVSGSGGAGASGSTNGFVSLATAQPQTPCVANMYFGLGGLQLAGAHPAVYCMGSANEPGTYVRGKQMQFPESILQCLGLGGTWEVCAWQNVQEPINLTAWGDPFARPYVPPFGSGAHNIGGSLKRGGTLKSQ